MENQERVEVNSVIYSADAQREMDAIVAKYVKQDAPKQETPLDRMQKLDRAAESKAQIIGLAVGIVAALVLGLGMSCALVWGQMVVGILVGLVGLACSRRFRCIRGLSGRSARRLLQRSSG